MASTDQGQLLYESGAGGIAAVVGPPDQSTEYAPYYRTLARDPLGSELGSQDRALILMSPSTVGHDEEMTVIKINAIAVPADSGDELAHRFAARAGAVDNADGFEGFELLKPTDGREQWLVLNRWRDEESFQAWVNSDSFAHGHRSAAERRGEGTPTLIATHSEIWSYMRAGGSGSG
jgi:heme oxygenase (mycobilin-producing)